MNRRGFTLIEILVAVGIASILATFATIRYREYLQSYRTEQQTRVLHAELQKARLAAVTGQRDVTVKFFPDRFVVYTSSVLTDNGGRTTKCPFPICAKFNLGLTTLTFDATGVAKGRGSICIDGGIPTGTVDSVVISPTRIAAGKLSQGNDCNADNIELR